MRAGERGPILKRDIRNFDSKTSSSAHKDIMPVHNIWQLQNKDIFFSLKSWWGFPVIFFIVHAQYGKCTRYIIMINLWQNDGCNGDVLHLAGHFPTLYAYIVILKTQCSWMFFDYYFWQWSHVLKTPLISYQTVLIPVTMSESAIQKVLQTISVPQKVSLIKCKKKKKIKHYLSNIGFFFFVFGNSINRLKTWFCNFPVLTLNKQQY